MNSRLSKVLVPTILVLCTLLLTFATTPVYSSESGSYTTHAGDRVDWVFTPPTPENPDGGFSWTLTCHHCGTEFSGTGAPPEWENQ